MGMLGLLFAALIIALLVMFQMRGQSPAPQTQPAAPVKEAAAAAKVDASNYAKMVQDVKTKVNAATQVEQARIQDLQQSQQPQEPAPQDQQ